MESVSARQTALYTLYKYREPIPGMAPDGPLGGGTLVGRYEARTAAYRDLPQRRARVRKAREELVAAGTDGGSRGGGGAGPDGGSRGGGGVAVGGAKRAGASRVTKLREVEEEERCIAEAEREEIEFLLDAMPFIREYCSTPGDKTAPACPSKPVTGRLDEFWDVSHTTNRHNVLQRYLLHVEKRVDATTYAAVRQEQNAGCNPRDAEFTCPSCNTGMEVDPREAMMSCPKCGVCRVSSEMQTTYDQEVHQDVSTYFSYKRQNHFCEWLNTIQGKENTEIPTQVIDAVRAEFKKIRASRRADITPAKVKEFLKKLRFNQFYEHTNSICNLLNGVPPPKLPADLEALLKAMFAEIQDPWKRNKPKERKNFLSYSFTLYKFCELLGEDWLLEYFPLLKCDEKLHKQDQLWRKICRDLRWEFIRSI